MPKAVEGWACRVLFFGGNKSAIIFFGQKNLLLTEEHESPCRISFDINELAYYQIFVFMFFCRKLTLVYLLIRQDVVRHSQI